MFKYDIPYPKYGQMTLKANGIPINVSKKKDYLVKKMKEQIELFNQGDESVSIQYEIEDPNGNVVFSYLFKNTL